ncbi:sugar phosphate isomerase/epimerase family protein [Priestia megaterium]|uniref:sugar phosphate isomerase/epimerase family protein n=1 Tax=Priestia megaterium TaxID=1404 RepID=UPI002A6A040C|nr:sugar phosphate isomerase/epimerase family protein [Priestia megaterium]MDY0943825.1 sugar phosphate isomerase/epimerase family protein [Priestia megaterium]
MKIAGHTMGTPELSLLEAIDLFADMGLDGIEIVVQDGYKSGFSPAAGKEEIIDVKKAAERRGLEIVCLTPYLSHYNSLDEQVRQQEVKQLKKIIDQAQNLNASFIRIYGGSFKGNEQDPNGEKRKRLVQSMREAGDYAAKAGVTLIIENHFNTMTVTATETAEILAEINHPAVKSLYDQANLAFVGAEKYTKAIPMQDGFIALVHAKDLVFREGKGPFKASSVSHVSEDERTVNSRVIGQGILPWPEILKSLKEHGFDGWLSMEYERRWHPQDLPHASEGMAEGARYLRQCLKTLEEETE